jgi:hypothetical protein
VNTVKTGVSQALTARRFVIVASSFFRHSSFELRGRLKSDLNLVLVLFMGIIDKAWDEHNRTIPERFYRERMEVDRAVVARAEDVWTTAALSAA